VPPSQERFAVVLVAFAGGVVAAVLLALINLASGEDPFAFRVFGLLPFGATFCGLAVGIVWFQRARRLDIYPTKSMLVQLMIAAMLCEPVIWVLAYGTRLLSKSGILPPSDFSQVAVRLATLAVCAVIVGFRLMSHPACGHCGRYLHDVASKTDCFPDRESFDDHYEGAFGLAPSATVFVPGHSGRRRASAMKLETRLLRCRGCGVHRVSQEVWRWEEGEDSSGWRRAAALARDVEILAGDDIGWAYGHSADLRSA